MKFSILLDTRHKKLVLRAGDRWVLARLSPFRILQGKSYVE